MTLKFPKAYYEKPNPVKVRADPSPNPAQVGLDRAEKMEPTRIVHDTYRADEPAVEMQDLPGASAIDISWLPWAAKTYHISPNLSDYVVKNMPICPADLPNRNGIGFPLDELVKYQPPPIARQVYKAWSGCPVHLEHDNEDCTKALGVIFDTSLRQVKTHGNGKHWMVHGLIGVDKNKFPEIAQKLLNNELNTGSMGALADYFTCSVCGHQCGENQFLNCAHITSTKNVNWKLVDYMGAQMIAFLNAHNLSPIEYSIVGDPAWASCLNDGVLG